MSQREALAATPAARIEEIRRSLPPAPGRKSRLGYISKDDFAVLVGAGRTRIIAWTTGQAYPEERFRRKLAELSEGRYEPADFANPAADLDRATTAADQVAERLAVLVARGSELADRLEVLAKRAQHRGAESRRPPSR